MFGKESGLPFYYRKLAGNIPDSKTVKHLLEDLDILGFGKTKFVMDRGSYSEDNINGLYREHVKFLVGTKLSLKIIKNHLDDVYDDIRLFDNYDDSIATYGYTVQTEWEYTQERPYKGDVIKDKRRMYIHYYYSIEKGADDESVESHKKAYEQFFEVKTTPKRGRQVYYKEDAIKEASSEKGLDGKIFTEFVALILIFHLDHKMKDSGLYSNYTMQSYLISSMSLNVSKMQSIH